MRDWGLKGKPISVHQVIGTVEEPQIIEIPIEVRSDTPREFAVQEKQPNNGNLKVLWDDHNKLKQENGYGHPPAIWVDWVELEGPLPKAGTKAGLARTLTDNLAGPKESESERARKNPVGFFPDRLSSGQTGAQIHRSTVGSVQNPACGR